MHIYLCGYVYVFATYKGTVTLTRPHRSYVDKVGVLVLRKLVVEAVRGYISIMAQEPTLYAMQREEHVGRF